MGVYSPDYGEILICKDVVKKEAKLAGNTQLFQMTWMIAHGILHLAGVHHEKSVATAKRFSRLEKQILGNMFKEIGDQ